MRLELNSSHKMALYEHMKKPKRATAFPVELPETWAFAKRAQQLLWTPEEVNMSADRQHFAALSDGTQRFIKYVLAFFAASDGLVNDNLADRFSVELGNVYEISNFYTVQMMMENVHAEMYSILLDTIIQTDAEKQFLLNAAKNIPVIERMSRYITDTTASTEPLPARLLKMACVEGIFFTGCFCAIYWIGRGKSMPGLVQSNELIARDEALHTTFALHLIRLCGGVGDEGTAVGIIKEAVSIAVEFARDALPVNLDGMNFDQMVQYIQHQANVLGSYIDLSPIYAVKNPFEWMNKINMDNKSNFFERRVSEYSKPVASSDVANYDADF